MNVVSATIDLDDVRSYRVSNPSFGIQAARLAAEEGGLGGSSGLPCDDVHLVWDAANSTNKNRPKITEESPALRIVTPEEECCLVPACWLWDYLRRSGAAGFLLPLSGEFFPLDQSLAFPLVTPGSWLPCCDEKENQNQM